MECRSWQLWIIHLMPMDKENIQCEFELCIYQHLGFCLLDDIHINAYGMCEDAMLVEIPHYLLDRYKRQHREKYI